MAKKAKKTKPGPAPLPDLYKRAAKSIKAPWGVNMGIQLKPAKSWRIGQCLREGCANEVKKSKTGIWGREVKLVQRAMWCDPCKKQIRRVQMYYAGVDFKHHKGEFFKGLKRGARLFWRGQPTMAALAQPSRALHKLNTNKKWSGKMADPKVREEARKAILAAEQQMKTVSLGQLKVYKVKALINPPAKAKKLKPPKKFKARPKTGKTKPGHPRKQPKKSASKPLPKAVLDGKNPKPADKKKAPTLKELLNGKGDAVKAAVAVKVQENRSDEGPVKVIDRTGTHA